SAPGNLVGNPGFETNTTGWKPSGSNVVLQRVAGGVSGGWAGSIKNSGASASSSTLKDSPNWVVKTAAGLYVISAWVRSDTTTNPVQIQIREYRSGTKVGSAQKSVMLSPGWQLVSFTYAAAAPGSSTFDLTVSAKLPAGASFL